MTQFTSTIEILAVNPVRSGTTAEGRKWEMQDAECILRSEDGAPPKVGVLRLAETMRGDNEPRPGLYRAAFGLGVSLKDRKVVAILTALTPFPLQQRPAAPKAA